MTEPTINVLSGVQTVEVSLVPRGANNKRIALTKSEDDDMDFQELLKTVLATEAEGEGALIETLKGSDDDTVEAAVASFRLQSGFKDRLNKDAFLAVALASGFIEKAKAKAEDEDDEEEDDKKPAFLRGKKKDKTVKSHTPADMPPQMEALFKAQAAETEALRKELHDVKAVTIRKDFIAKCAEQYSHVPGMSAEEMGDMLLEAHGVSKEFGERLEKQWGDTHAAVKASEMLTSQGAAQVNIGSTSSAWGQMQQLAKEKVAKGEAKSEAHAMNAVMSEKPELYKEYLDDNPAQRARN